MPAYTFACPECGRRAGARLESAGRAVRCPFCKKVVVAPGPDGRVVKPATPPAAATPQAAVPADVPRFDLPRTERPDSIFHEGGPDDDAVFEAAPIPAHRLEMPGGPPPDDPPPEQVLPPSDPWGRLHEEPPSPAPTPSAAPAPGVQPATDRRLRIALAAVAAYALLATAFAVWSYFRGGDRGHPLLFVPDTFGEYPPASRDRVSDLRGPLRAMGWDGETIPPELRVRLGSRLAVGDLIVEPLSVDVRRVNRVTLLAGNAAGPTSAPLPHPCLVLVLRLTNTSKSETFHPTDPAFNRKAVATTPPPLTGVIVSDRTCFPGGPVVWPFAVGVKRSYIEGHEADAEPLRPGQTRRAEIVSDSDPALLDAIGSATAPVTWQVHLRRGVTRVRGQDVSVGALVGVEFEPQAVRRSE